ncbi:MAG: cytochrome b [Pseudomonadota bacterium]
MARTGIVRYGGVAQAFHWLIAALIFIMIALGYYMEDLPLGTRKLELYQLHKSIGISIALLALLRLAWRFMHPPPPLPDTMKPWERSAAHLVHWLLYAMLFIQPLIGFLQSNAANFPVVLWGTVPLPALIGPDEPFSNTLLSAHTIGAYVLATLVIVHVGAALRHHFVIKDDVLRRMLPGPTAHP